MWETSYYGAPKTQILSTLYVVYVGVQSESTKTEDFVAISWETGDQVWKTDDVGHVGGFMSGDQTLILTAQALTVTALNVTTGDPVWKYKTSGIIYSMSYDGKNTLFVGTGAGGFVSHIMALSF